MVLQKRGIVVKSLLALDILYSVIFPIIYSNSKKDLLNSTLSENIYYICRDIFIRLRGKCNFIFVRQLLIYKILLI